MHPVCPRSASTEFMNTTTIRGFNSMDVQLVDGMRMEGNRFNTQLNNVQQVDVLKGPSSILYGSGALGGAINIIRKKPQSTRLYDLSYRTGRWNLQQVAGGAAGSVTQSVLFRVDASFEHNDAWRHAGANRLNVSPTVTWLINNNNRVTVHQAFNRDRFRGDGGLPIETTLIPGFDLGHNFGTSSDFGHILDSQTHVLFNSSLSPSWEFRNGFFYRATNDRYFVTEGLFYNADDYAVDRYALYFKHHRRPKLNQSDVVGRLNFWGMRHTILAGYEYEDYYNYTNVTPDGGDYFPSSVSLTTLEDTQGPITSFPTARVNYFAGRTNAFYWQDQISITEKLKINVGGRFDNYHRVSRGDPWANGAATARGPEAIVDQNAYTYRAGLVYSLPASMQLYGVSATAFTPLTTIPSDGSTLKPVTGCSYEVGHRWQGWNGRVQTSLAFYKIERQNVVIPLGMNRYAQAGQQSSRGIDLDINSDIGHGIRLVANYGYTLPRYDDYTVLDFDYAGRNPRFVQRHAVNLWLNKAWRSGITASAGMRYLGPMFSNDENTIRLGGWTTFGGAISYRRRIWELSLNAENLLNRQRYFMGSDYEDQVYPGAPINVFMTVRFRFE